MEKREIIESFLRERIKRQCGLLGVESIQVRRDTDLIKEGFFDSLSFVDLIGDCEREFNVTIDLDNFNPADFTKFGNLTDIVQNAKGA